MKHVQITRFRQQDYAHEEAINTLCTNLSYCGTDIKTVLITSRYAMEGKSFIAMSMLRAMANLDKRTILVDTDLRRSQLHAQYGLRYAEDGGAGLVDYLAGLCELEDALYETDIPNAYMIPAGRSASNPLRLLTSPRFARLLDYLSKEYAAVLVDSSPIGMVIDAAEVGRHCDGALLVVSYNRGRRRDVAGAVETVERAGCKVLGAVLNNVEFGSYGNRKFYYRSERYASYYRRGYGFFGGKGGRKSERP